jgi:hypothetical protein
VAASVITVGVPTFVILKVPISIAPVNVVAPRVVDPEAKVRPPDKVVNPETLIEVPVIAPKVVVPALATKFPVMVTGLLIL